VQISSMISASQKKISHLKRGEKENAGGLRE
jgi:hypothetical protein